MTNVELGPDAVWKKRVRFVRYRSLGLHSTYFIFCVFAADVGFAAGCASDVRSELRFAKGFHVEDIHL
jgi:hypothetical protein